MIFHYSSFCFKQDVFSKQTVSNDDLKVQKYKNIISALSQKKEAYIYLNKTIETFPSGRQFCHLLEINHFISAKMHPLMLGAVTIYQADKPLTL